MPNAAEENEIAASGSPDVSSASSVSSVSSVSSGTDAGDASDDELNSVVQASNIENKSDTSGERKLDSQSAVHYEYQGDLKGDFDIVTVHGLYGDNQTTWQSHDPNKRESLKGILGLRDHFNCRQLNYGYTPDGSVLSRDEIFSKAFDLLRYIMQARRALKPDTLRPIVFISHDVGGAIIKRALFVACTTPDFVEIAHSARMLIFFGYPHRHRSFQELTDALARLVFSAPEKVSSWSKGVIQTHQLAKTIVECNNGFIESKMLLHASIISILSSKQAVNEQIFDQYMATINLGQETRIDCAVAHGNLARAVADSQELWDILVKYIETFKEKYLRSDTEPDPSSDILASCAPPLWPLNKACYAEPAWLTRHPAFAMWEQSPVHSILLVLGPCDESDRLSQSVFATTSALLRDYPVYFSFDRHDTRRNTVKAFLLSCIAQWTRAGLASPRDARMLHARAVAGASAVDVFDAWRRMRTGGVQDATTVVVLSNVGDCVDLAPSFWSQMARLFAATEAVAWKFVVFARPDDGLDAGLKKWPTIGELAFPTGSDHDVDREVRSVVLQLLDADYTAAAERVLCKAVADRCGKDVALARFVTGQLRRVSMEPEAIKASVARLVEDTLDSICQEKRGFVANMLSWVLCAFRPLSVTELAAAAGGPRDLAQVLDELLPGMFDTSGSDVRFSHPEVRAFLQTAECSWYAVVSTAHSTITQTCLNHLTTTTDERLPALCDPRLGIWETPICKPQDNLTAYAAEYWPEHYKLVTNKDSLRECVQDFLQNGTQVSRWGGARWALTNPITRTPDKQLSPLALIASVGLEDVFEQLHGDKAALRSALVEACRNGHSRLALRIVSSVRSRAQLNTSTADAALIAAASHGEDEDFQVALIEQVSDHFGPKFRWPPQLLLRAAHLGHTSVAQALIRCGASVDIADELPTKQGPLHAAAAAGRVQVVRVLLNADASIAGTRDASGLSPLRLAVVNGHADVVNVLLETGGAGQEAEGEAIVEACRLGMHAAARALLQVRKAGTLHLPQIALAVAAERGFVECARALVDYGADVDGQEEDETALYKAVVGGHGRMCRFLLQNGANPNCSGQRGPAIVLAAQEDRLDIVELLVQHEAEVDARDDDDSPTALIAALKKSVEMVRYLLQNGANVNATIYSDPIIFKAAIGSDINVLRAVVNARAALNVTSRDGWTPLHGAFERAEHTRILLMAGADIDKLNVGNDKSPLYLAAEMNKPDVVDALLEFRPKLDLRCSTGDYPGSTALIAAVRNRCLEVVKKLLAAGASPNVQTDNGTSVIHFAAAKQDADLLATLLDSDPDLDLTNRWGNTPLNDLLYSDNPSLSIVRLLVGAGCDVNKADINGIAPLHRAVEKGNLNIARFLLKCGRADISLSPGRWGAPLHVACFRSAAPTDAVSLLLDAGADLNQISPPYGTPMVFVCLRAQYHGSSRETEDVVEALLRLLQNSCSNKLDLNRASNYYGTPLAAACICGVSTRTVELLLAAGADVSVADPEAGRLPVHHAAQRSVEFFEMLVGAGADMGARDGTGCSVLSYAARSACVELVRHILRRTGKAAKQMLHDTDVDGWTPLHYAARGYLTIGCESRAMAAAEEDESGSDAWKRLAGPLKKAQTEVVKLLVEEGADLRARVKGPDGKMWSPLKLARYHGAVKEVQMLLTPADCEDWVDAEHEVKRGARKPYYCDRCTFTIFGQQYRCKVCPVFHYCFKCYARKDYFSVHRDHGWEEIGPEFEEVEGSESEEGDKNDDDSASVSSVSSDSD